MSPFDPNKPPTHLETTSNQGGTQPPEVPATGEGVKVIVRNRPPPRPRRAQQPPERFPRVVIVPPEEATREQDALIQALCEEHGEFIRQTLLRRGDVLAESTKDLQQRVLLVLREQITDKGVPDNVRGFLIGVIRNEIRNHKRMWRPPVQRGAEPDEMTTSMTDPEEAAELAERRAKLERYLTCLPPEEAELIRCIDLLGMTIDQAAAKVGRHRSTVATQHARAMTKLEELARESDRETALGARRRGSR